MNIIYREVGYHYSVSLCLRLASGESEVCNFYCNFVFHSNLKFNYVSYEDFGCDRSDSFTDI